MLKCWNITPFMFFNHMINKVNSQKTTYFCIKRWAGHKHWMNGYLYLFEIFVPFSVAEYEHRIYLNFIPAAGVLFSLVHNDIWLFPTVHNDISGGKAGKSCTHSLTHSCSNYISHCQFFSQPRWVFGKKVKFLEKELFMLKGTSCDTLKSVPIQLISRRN